MSDMSHVLAVIPARYGSTRFPGKPLVEIDGKPMIQHVWERVRLVSGIQRVVVATDDARIQDAVRAFGAEVVLTDASHPSGTDRVWEVAQFLPEYDWILNVQGDEPFINPQHLKRIIDAIRSDIDILTLVTPLESPEQWRNPNIVKAVLAQSNQTLYFSRSPIPYHRDDSEVPRNAFRHIGLYLYKREALDRFTQLPPSPLEQLERLEQLRVLEAGLSIHAVIVDSAPIGIDTPEDLMDVQEIIRTGVHKF